MSKSEFISLHEASQEYGYHQDYLGLLIRQKKIPGRKVGRTWMTTRKSVEGYCRSKREKKHFSFFSLLQKPIFSLPLFFLTSVFLVVSLFFAFSFFFIEGEQKDFLVEEFDDHLSDTLVEGAVDTFFFKD